MSAYVVEREHIQYLVWVTDEIAREQYGALSWYHNGERQEVKAGDVRKLAEIGQMLWTENQASVAYRYDEQPEGQRFGIVDVALTGYEWNTAQAVKAINCLSYQSCERPDWEQSAAHSFLVALKDLVVDTIPGYEEAIWGAPERNKPMAAVYAQRSTRRR